MQKKLISIIVPVYNVEKYLCECINSIINQKVKHWELILVDDGSTDRSGSICDNYVTKDNRIRVIHKQNGGVSSARNIGIEEAKGEWLVFVDADDWVDENYLTLIFENIDRGYQIIHFGYNKQLSDGSIQVRNPNSLGEVMKSDFFTSLNWSSVSVSFSFSADLLKRFNIKFPNGMRTSEDRVFIGSCVLASEKILCVYGSHYTYRYTPGSAVNSRKAYSLNRSNLIVTQKIVDFANKHCIDISESAIAFIYKISFDEHMAMLIKSDFDANEEMLAKQDLKLIATDMNIYSYSLLTRLSIFIAQRSLRTSIILKRLLNIAISIKHRNF